MTIDEADGLMAKLLAAYPNWNAPGVTQQLYLDHLRALPFERGSAGVGDLIARSTFPPAVGELMLACGIDSQEGRDQLKRAMATEGELVRDFRASSGWRLAGEALPELPMPTRMQARRIGEVMRDVLPVGAMPISKALAGPSTALAPVRQVVPLDDATVRQRTEQLQQRAQDAIDAYERETRRLAEQRQRLVAEAAGLAGIRAEAEDALLGGEVPPSMVKAVAEKLLRRLADDPDEGRIACVEVLAAACLPGLEVKELRYFPDDESPQTVRLVLKRKAG